MGIIHRCIARVVVALLVVGVVTIATGVRPASACSCVGYTDAEAFAAADVVFTATLVDVRKPTVMLDSTDLTRLVFDVSHVFKGHVSRTQSVVTASDSASCGLAVDGVGPFLVFARSDADGALDGELGSGLCSGTRSLGAAPVPPEFGAGLAAEQDAPAEPDAASAGDQPGSPAIIGDESPIGRDDSSLAMIALAVFALVAVIASLVFAARTIARRRPHQRG